jgi:hypothetical protein
MEGSSTSATAIFSPRCGATRSNGEPCKNPAGYGTTHPGFGKCKRHYGNTPAHQRSGARAMIRAEALRICEERGVDPGSVTPELVMIEELARSYAMVNYLESETDVDAAMWPDWQNVMLAERKHQMEVAKVMIAAGIMERHTRLAEGQAQLLGLAIRAILDKLTLTEEQRGRAPTIVREVLAELPAA